MIIFCVFRYNTNSNNDEHSEREDRWITFGTDENGILLVISHTAHKMPLNQWNIRLISARKATKAESSQYEE
ncbi:BrnT family toxin [Desulfamplus magnetovallimortis]|uniref:BrnT family toxin n=1 Tax=Desulfamplus magnetovallimortis TaxID=1246637 RepID=UPI0009BB97AB